MIKILRNSWTLRFKKDYCRFFILDITQRRSFYAKTWFSRAGCACSFPGTQNILDRCVPVTETTSFRRMLQMHLLRVTWKQKHNHLPKSVFLIHGETNVWMVRTSTQVVNCAAWRTRNNNKHASCFRYSARGLAIQPVCIEIFPWIYTTPNTTVELFHTPYGTIPYISLPQNISGHSLRSLVFSRSPTTQSRNVLFMTVYGRQPAKASASDISYSRF